MLTSVRQQSMLGPSVRTTLSTISGLVVCSARNRCPDAGHGPVKVVTVKLLELLADEAALHSLMVHGCPAVLVVYALPGIHATRLFLMTPAPPRKLEVGVVQPDREVGEDNA
jgi:hypothetical protein